MKAKQTLSIIYEEIKHYFKLDEEGNLWNLLTGSGQRGKKGEWKPCYQNKPNKAGYLHVSFKGALYLQHRIIYCLYTKLDVPTNLQIDHIDGDRVNNNIDNLRLVTRRENCQNQSGHRNGRLPGTTYNKPTKKWQAQILLSNGELVSLGYFNSEVEAHQRYIEALNLIHLNKIEIQKHFNLAQFTSKYKGVSWHKNSHKWIARITVNSKLKHLGYFNSEEEAHQAYLNFKKGGAS